MENQENSGGGKVFKKLFPHFNPKMLIFLLVAVVAMIYLAGYLRQRAPQSLLESLGMKPNYAEAFVLIEDSVSQSAEIQINVPPELKKEEMAGKIKFLPEIKGNWQEAKDDKKLIFKPEEKLPLGKFYTAILETEKVNLKKDFQIAEDPAVVSVFPKNESEADENSNITIIFNRPMVPLTSLDVLSDLKIPVDIAPATKGKYKWIGTKTLQFIPEKGLLASANYIIKVKSDFISLDGLKIKDFEHKFTTRKLRYAQDYISENEVTYNQPFVINFNQAVDLAKTAKEISIQSKNSPEKVDILVEYGQSQFFNQTTKKEEKRENRSQLFIYKKADKYGRKKLWDFESGYYLEVNKAYPADGDIALEEKRAYNINIPEVTSGLYTSSPRSSESNPDFFDPRGQATVSFYEDIDLNKSEIGATKVKEIKYGSKCRDAAENDNENCEKTEDKSTVVLTFQEDRIGRGETLLINLNRLVNVSGLQLNQTPIIKKLKVIPELTIYKSSPAANGQGASLNDFILCTSLPLNARERDGIGNFFQSNNEYEFKNWGVSYLVNDSQGNFCDVKQFQTYINYAIQPKKKYEISLKLESVFDDQKDWKVAFSSGEIPEGSFNFYHFQPYTIVTTPDKTKLTYATENLITVNLHICKLEAENMLRYQYNRPGYLDGPDSLKNCSEIKTAKIDLPEKYWLKNYFQVNLADYFPEKIGHYILTFSSPKYVEQGGDRKGSLIYERTYLSISNLGIIEKKTELNEQSEEYTKLSDKNLEKLKNLYWVTGLKTLSNIKGAQVDVYSSDSQNQNNELKQAASATTNEQGIAEVKPVKNARGLIVRQGQDSAILVSDENKLDYGSTAYNARKIYMYTDKPIYLPGEQVNVKALYRVGYDGNYEIFKDTKVPVKAYTSDDTEIFKQDVAVSDFGTFSFSFKLDSKAPLGKYRIGTFGNYYDIQFDVEEYTPAPFKVESKINQEEYISGDNLEADINASYYFGAPVESGQIEYTIVSQNYYFDRYQDDYFNFGGDWYYCYDCSYGDKFITRGQSNLDSSGHGRISTKLDFAKFFKEDERDSKIFVLYTTVKNRNGQSVSTQKSFIVHNGEFYLGLEADPTFVGKGQKFNLKAKSVDTKGNNLKISDIELTINKVDWNNVKRKEVDGSFYYSWEKKKQFVKNLKFSTDLNGNWNKEEMLDKDGEFEIEIKQKDQRGNPVKATKTVYVWGDSQESVRQTNNEELEVIQDKTSLKTGEKGSLIFKSPYKKAKALISIERGRIFEYKIIDVTQSLNKYEFTVKDEYYPNVYVSVSLISDDPGIKYRSVQYNIDTAVKKIDLSVKSSKDYYLPGEKVKLNFEAKDIKGQPVETELSVAVVDLSVLALKGNPKKDPLIFFYDGFPLTISTASNLKNFLEESKVPTGTKGGDGGAKSADLAKKKRGEFRDVAFWKATIKTDAQGRGEIEFNLPDNLTSWQAEAVGVSRDTKVGAGYTEFTSRKNLMLQPLLPRFVLPGDSFAVGAKVFNQTDSDQILNIEIKSETLEVKNPIRQVNLKKGETATYYFEAEAPLKHTAGMHRLTLSAKNANYEDVVEWAIKINRNETYENVSTSGYTNGLMVKESVYVPQNITKDRGGLTINYSASLAVFMSDGLKYLYQYPYGCTEQIGSKLEAIAAVRKGLGLKNIGQNFVEPEIEFDGETYKSEQVLEMGLNRIYENWNDYSGFSYYKNGNGDLYLTLKILSTLKRLREANIPVNDNIVQKAVLWTQNTIRDGQQNNQKQPWDRETVILAYYTLFPFPEFKDRTFFVDYVKNLEKDGKFLSEDISNLTLTRLAKILNADQKSFGKNYRDNIYKILENRIEIDSRGAYLPEKDESNWRFYESRPKNTAFLLEALVSKKESNPILDKVLRWLLASRSRDGSWGSTDSTISVIWAMTDYISWQQENESNFSVKVNLNDIEKSSFNYGGANIMEQKNLFIDMTGLNEAFNQIDFVKENKNNLPNNLYYDLSLKYYLPADRIAPRDEGFSIQRSFYNPEDKDNLKPLTTAKVGDILKGHISIITPKDRNFVAVEDYLPAGVELINFDLATENTSLLRQWDGYNIPSNYYGDVADKHFYPDKKELRSDRLYMYTNALNKGEYEFDYYVRVLVPGNFIHLPAVVSEMYAPENFGRTRGTIFKVVE